MRSNTWKNPISPKDIKAATKAQKKKEPEPNPLDKIDSQEDYPDLSVSIISDDGAFDINFHKTELVKSVKQSLAELKSEAHLYLHSGDKAIQENNKKLRESCLSVESSNLDQESINILNELKISIKSLHERLEKNEERFMNKREENLQLHEIVNSLESKFKEHIVIDTAKKASSCFCF